MKASKETRNLLPECNESAKSCRFSLPLGPVLDPDNGHSTVKGSFFLDRDLSKCDQECPGSANERNRSRCSR